MIRALVPEDAAALAELAGRPDVVRAGLHHASDSIELWDTRIGPADPTRRFGLAFHDRGLRAALLVELGAHRRRVHTATLTTVAPDDGDDALYALLEPALDAIDRWMQAPRVEVTLRADHPRADDLFARHGFVREVRLRKAISEGPSRLDLAVLARLDRNFAFKSATARAAPPRAVPLEGEVLIRPVVPEDGAGFAAMMSEPSVVWGTMQLPFQRPDLWGPRFAANDPTRFFVYAAEHEGAIVGNVALIVPPEVRRRHAATLGMAVAERAQGRGLGRRLMTHAISVAKDELGLERLELEVYADNARAIALYESFGFVREGSKRAAAYRDGGYADDLAMALSL